MPVYESSVRSGSIAAAGTYNVVFNTGNTPAVFLNRSLGFAGTGYTATVSEAPTGITGGTSPTPFPTDQILSPAAKGVVTYGATVSGIGTPIAATTYFRGGAGVGQSVVGTFGSSQGTRRLKPNTTYLLQCTNNDAGAQTLDIYLRWYEGPDPSPTGTV